MVKEFEGKNQWAIILGGSSGLGLATAKKLSAHGCNICIIHRNSKAQLAEIETEFEHMRSNSVKVVSYNKDALKPEIRTQICADLKEVLGATGTVKIMIHSIAKGNLKPMQAEDQQTLMNDDFQLTIMAMAISLYDWTKSLFDANLFDADTRIISFTSEGNRKAWRSYAAVSAAKVALEAITRNIALEFAPFGIKANCIQAGVTDTTSLRMIPGSEKIKTHAIARNPFKRLTAPQDVANAAYLLCKDEAIWINGSIIPVDGGEHIS